MSVQLSATAQPKASYRQDSLSRAQTECHRAAEEKRQMRAYIEELERARGGLRLHEGRPYEEGQPANETSPISNSSRHARDGTYLSTFNHSLCSLSGIR
jgi:hypothetical protein